MEQTPVNPTDIAVLAIVLLSALLSFARGFVREILSVAAWIGAAVAAIWAFPHAKPFAASFISMDVAAGAAAFVGVFAIALIILSLLFSRLSRGVRTSSLSAIDRSLGFLFGVARGAVLVCLAYLLVAWVFPPGEQPAWLREARTMPVIQSGAERLRRLVPDDMQTDAERRAASAAEAARAGATQAAREEALRRLSTPTATPRPAVPASDPGASPTESGYNQQERTQLQGLFERSAGAN